ncbi:4-coumarate--CoA ligase 1-like [Vanessa cardui]|uniref:4-coumarate--CoA ligase 1-like n=1 Tax=Vanessa cardui TaxID=171605 RepID=UPI001F12FC50|nr:4-coumarate--CoA ligase 1-like [Vanessa cardui]
MLKNRLYVYGDDVVGVPSHLNFGQYMVTTMWNHGDKTAMINGITHERLTYRDIVKDAMNIAISLTRIGVKRGDIVAICSENRQEYWSAFIGTSCTGATFTATNSAYTQDELQHVLNISKPKMIFCSQLAYKAHEKTLRSLSYMEKIIIFGTDRLPNTLSYNDLVNHTNITLETFRAADVVGQTDTAVILYSSGTTGLPKGVMLTHLNILTTCNVSSTMNPKQPSLTITPWYHTMGLMGNLRILASGSYFVYLPKFECELYLRTIERYQIVQIIVAPPVLVALCKYESKYDVSSVQLVYSGAAPLRSDTINAVKVRFPNVTSVLQGYGMTESTLGVTRDTYDKAHLSKIGSVGRAVSGCTIKVVDIETKVPLGVNQPGEIYVKGSLVMKGYIGKNRSEDFDDEGFFKTGDIGYYDEDGCFFIVDRLKELIKYKGYQVPPAEIEAVLLQHPSVRDVGVVGIPHADAGEVPRAYVVLQPEANVTEDEIKNLVKQKLSNPKHLRGGVQFVKEIPKNPSGKILRRKLREMSQIKNEARSKL